MNAVATIVDDEVQLSIADATTTEGHGGTKLLTFTASLSQATAGPVYFRAATGFGSATPGSDFVARSPTLLAIPAGQLARTFSVTLNGDTTVEDNETFVVNLSDVTGATLYDSQATGTLLNDDGPTLSINDPAVSEGASGLWGTTRQSGVV
jgi:hypothetical protein